MLDSQPIRTGPEHYHRPSPAAAALAFMPSQRSLATTTTTTSSSSYLHPSPPGSTRHRQRTRSPSSPRKEPTRPTPSNSRRSLSPAPAPGTRTARSSTSTSTSTLTLAASLAVLPSLASSTSSHFKERLEQFSQLGRSAHGRAVDMIPAIDFVPSRVPPKRRLQTLTVAIWELLIPILYSAFLFLCAYPPLWPLVAGYLFYIYFVDGGPENGGRSSRWFRSMRCWKYFVDYYPASIKKEQDLPADRPYVFGYHPHGIIGMGALATFAMESTGFPSLFPGIKPHLLTLSSNFKVPFYREVLMWAGICSVSRTSCTNILRQGDGAAICIVVGGAAESLSAHPGTADLTLRRRLGFIKLAIQYGADLVPVFSFGENDIFEQMPNERGTLLYSLQKRFQAMFGFTLPLFHGRGMLNYTIGLMPYRRRIVVVIGRPINVEKCEKPTLEQLHAVQKEYIEELYRIWDTYKDAFAAHRKRELSIID